MKKLKRNIKITKMLILLCILFIIVNIGILGFQFFAAASVNYVTQSENIEAPEPLNFMIIGSDLGGNRSFEDDGVRTDVQMILSLVPQNERGNVEINIMNIPRDVTTDYACGGYGKINGAADAAARDALLYGEDPTEAAINCTIGTAEQMFNITIDYYMFLDFDSFISIVDGIGGIDLINQTEFCEQDENGVADAYCFEEGKIHLDGGAALAYARQRYMSSDYERGQRQQLIMTKVFTKIISNPSAYITSFANSIISDTVNNLDLELLIKLLNWASTSYNSLLSDISSNTPLFIDVKSSPFSLDTGFDLTKSLGENIDAVNVGNFPIYELYETYDTIEQSTTITRYAFTKNNLGLPTNYADTSDTAYNVIELQYISTFVYEENGPSGFYSYIDDYTASFINNQFDNNYSSTANFITDTIDQF